MSERTTYHCDLCGRETKRSTMLVVSLRCKVTERTSLGWSRDDAEPREILYVVAFDRDHDFEAKGGGFTSGPTIGRELCSDCYAPILRAMQCNVKPKPKPAPEPTGSRVVDQAIEDGMVRPRAVALVVDGHHIPPAFYAPGEYTIADGRKFSVPPGEGPITIAIRGGAPE